MTPLASHPSLAPFADRTADPLSLGLAPDRLARISAWMRRYVDAGKVPYLAALVARRGEKTGGMVLLKLNQRERGVRLLGQTRDLDGRLAWLPALEGALVPEAEAEAYIARAVKRDPDVWVVEIEHPDGWHPFEGKLL